MNSVYLSKAIIQNNIEMNQTQNKPKYYYLPRFRHFNIYQRESNPTSTLIDDARTQEEASDKVYKLNGWNNPKTTRNNG